MLKVNDYVRTPRFCTVKISEVFNSEQDARKAGYTEPTHCEQYKILGKNTGLNKMIFCAVQ